MLVVVISKLQSENLVSQRRHCQRYGTNSAKCVKLTIHLHKNTFHTLTIPCDCKLCYWVPEKKFSWRVKWRLKQISTTYLQCADLKIDDFYRRYATMELRRREHQRRRRHPYIKAYKGLIQIMALKWGVQPQEKIFSYVY